MAYFDPIRCDYDAVAHHPGDNTPAITAGTGPFSGWHVLVSGTRIMTPDGTRDVSSIKIGDCITTRHHGVQQVFDVRHCAMSRQALIAAPRLTPVSVGAGALGLGKPLALVWMHPMACIASPGAASARRAKDLVGDSNIARVFPDSVTYVSLNLVAGAEVQVEGLWLVAQLDLQRP